MISSLEPKQRIFNGLAKISQAISDRHRLEILELLAQGERSVDELASLIGMGVANTSRHLQILRRAGIAGPRRDGKRMLYRLINQNETIRLLTILGQIGERNIPEIQIVMSNYFKQRDSLAPLTREMLWAMMKAGDVTLLDIRPAYEFEQSHLPGALNMPLCELEDRVVAVPKNQQVIVYCRGPYCGLAIEAAGRLRALGYKALRLADGYPEWQAAGLPVES